MRREARTAPLGIERRQVTRKLAGYGAAAAVSSYLLVKVVWVAAALAGVGEADDVGTAEWVMLNLATVVMAAVGVGVGLAMAQRWGQRIPAAPLVFVTWVGAGLLVPLLPFMVGSALIGADSGGREGSSGGTEIPAWEGVLLSVGFVGMAVGLSVALPLYMRERWPSAFHGSPSLASLRWDTAAALLAATGLGLLWLFWALGGSFGLDAGRETASGRLLLGSWALAAFAGAWSLGAMTTWRTHRVPLGLLSPLAFTASGSLFAWNAWKMFAALLAPGGYAPMEEFAVAVVTYSLGMVAGVLMLIGCLRAVRSATHRR